jgi:CRP-like cAMP-binding protein
MQATQPDILRGLTEEEANAFLALGTRLRLTAGAVLFELGEEARSLYLLNSGRITLTLPMAVQDSEQDVFVEERTAGQSVGWSSLNPPYRFTLAAKAAVESEVLEFPRERLHEFFAANPAAGCTVALNLSAVIGHRLQLFQAMWLREMQRVVELSCV